MSTQTPTTDIRAVAISAYRAGLCIIPVREDGSKAPDVIEWSSYQSIRPDRERMRQWFDNDRQGLILVCGYDDIEAIDFDRHDVFSTFVDTADAAGLGEIVERIRNGYQEHTPNGVHLIYRCKENANGKLARDMSGSTLIETKGSGGYVVIAPSGGDVHHSGKPYELIRGGFDSIVTITPGERAALHELARAFDEYRKHEWSGGTAQSTARPGETRPGDAYNINGPAWPELLAGWTLVYRRGKTEYWRRPGKDHGISATINGPGVSPDRLYVFSSNAIPFEDNRSYTKFQAYTLLEHGGDFSAAAASLAAQGHGDGPDGASFTFSTNGHHKEDDLPAISAEDFYAYLPDHKYIFIPTRDLWPAASINSRFGKGSAAWLDAHRPVEQMTWAPGQPMLIEDRLLVDGGWIDREGVASFNLYREPMLQHGNADDVDPWLTHVNAIYPNDAGHLIRWFAHRVQYPGDKINHALVLGGTQGIGKDTLLEPLKMAVGEWNFKEVTPTVLIGRFNPWLKSVVLRISEARDMGDMNRYAFYEHMKGYTAAPPDVLRVDEKNLREYAIMNVTGVVITTNHKSDGMYLPAEDRRHYVAWSDAQIGLFHSDYFKELYEWYRDGGYANVAAYLASIDLGDFDSKAPPKKTPAFWDIVNANRAPEDDELVDVLYTMGDPDAVTINQIRENASADFAEWLKDRRNSRAIPHRLESVGYVAVRNETQQDGRWKVNGKNVVIYAKTHLDFQARTIAAHGIVRYGYLD